jgi:hypothetical protein
LDAGDAEIDLDAGDAEIDQDGGPLKGEYDTNTIHFFAVNLIWKF